MQCPLFLPLEEGDVLGVMFLLGREDMGGISAPLCCSVGAVGLCRVSVSSVFVLLPACGVSLVLVVFVVCAVGVSMCCGSSRLRRGGMRQG